MVTEFDNSWRPKTKERLQRGGEGGSRKGGKREHSREKGERKNPLEDRIGRELKTG